MASNKTVQKFSISGQDWGFIGNFGCKLGVNWVQQNRCTHPGLPMYSKTKSGKASKGSVVVIASNNRLQLCFRVSGQRKYVSLGLPDTPENWRLAEMKAQQMELDILAGHFDQTLERYKLQAVLSVAAPDITPKPTPILELVEDAINELALAPVAWPRLFLLG